MKFVIDGKLIWASVRLTFLCVMVATLLTYLALSLVINTYEGHGIRLFVGLGIAASVTLLMGFPVFFMVRYQRHQLELVNKKLLSLIRYDQLTGLLSRVAFFEGVEKTKGENASTNQYDAVFFMDLDYFKKINDRYGHAAGDEVLRRFGSVVSNQLQDGDLACRLGGEEFAVFIPNCTPKIAEDRAKKLAKTFAGEVIEFNGVEIRCTVSIGVYAENKGENLDVMLNKADELLYKAKQSGRNRVISRHVSRLAAETLAA